MTDRLLNVKNRSASMVVYRIPEDGIRREFAPSETKKIKYSELEKLSYQAGGKALMENFLQIYEDKAVQNLNLHTENEYYMSEQDVINLLNNGSLEAFLDCLDFAPVGVIDLVKKFAVSLPLKDLDKREALKNKTGFDVSHAIEMKKAEEFERNAEKNSANKENSTPIEPVTETKPTGRRTSTNYKVVNKEEK